MAIELTMPQMGYDMQEGTVVRWLKAEGDDVGKGDLIAEIETDKAVVEFQSYADGKLHRILVPEGDTVPVGAPIALVGEEGEVPAAAPAPPPPAPEAAEQEPPAMQVPAPPLPDPVPPPPPARSEDDHVRASPVARRIAEERGIDLAQLSGTGPGGRITREDVEQAGAPGADEWSATDGAIAPEAGPEAETDEPAAAAEEEPAAGAVPLPGGPVDAGMDEPVAAAEEEPAAEAVPLPGGPAGPEMDEPVAAAEEEPAAEAVPLPSGPVDAGMDEPVAAAEEEPAAEAVPLPAAPAEPEAEDPAAVATDAGTGEASDAEPLSRMRRQIVRVTVGSKTEIPHFYVSTEIDMTGAMEMRGQINASPAFEGARVSVNDMILKACVDALRSHPKFNASFTPEGIRMNEAINIGMAVAGQESLIVPAISGAQDMSLREIAVASRDLAERAKGGTITAGEYTSGTFTVSNLGMFDVSAFVAIIHPPQAAVLAVGSVARRPVVRGDRVEIADLMTATVSADHRVVDGAEGALFVGEIKSILENPYRLLV